MDFSPYKMWYSFRLDERRTMEIRRRCEECNVVLVLADEVWDKVYCFCPVCGAVAIFFKSKTEETYGLDI